MYNKTALAAALAAACAAPLHSHAADARELAEIRDQDQANPGRLRNAYPVAGKASGRSAWPNNLRLSQPPQQRRRLKLSR